LISCALPYKIGSAYNQHLNYINSTGTIVMPRIQINIMPQNMK